MDKPNVYADALLSQTACNASGLFLSLAGHMDELWKEARELGKGTDYVNQHPVIRLFLEQLTFLNGCSIDGAHYEAWKSAFEICKKKSNRKDLTP